MEKIKNDTTDRYDDLFINVETLEACNDEYLGIKNNYLEYQKMTFIILLYSEIEKLIDNLVDLKHNSKAARNLKQKLQMLVISKGFNKDIISRFQNTVNEIRLVRNKLVHAYDHWDDEIKINGTSYKGLKQLDDNYFGNIIKDIVELV